MSLYHTLFIADEEEPLLLIISPINKTGNISGTYEIVLSMEPPVFSDSEQIRYMLLTGVVSIAILIFSLLIIMGRFIEKTKKNE